VVKVDAKGSVDAVLKGAARTLERDRPFIFCEVLDRRDLATSVATILAGHGYRFFRLGRRGSEPCLEILGGGDRDESHNYLFVHPSRTWDPPKPAQSTFYRR
jgi:hypothetical protein